MAVVVFGKRLDMEQLSRPLAEYIHSELSSVIQDRTILYSASIISHKKHLLTTVVKNLSLNPKGVGKWRLRGGFGEQSCRVSRFLIDQLIAMRWTSKSFPNHDLSPMFLTSR